MTLLDLGVCQLLASRVCETPCQCGASLRSTSDQGCMKIEYCRYSLYGLREVRRVLQLVQSKANSTCKCDLHMGTVGPWPRRLEKRHGDEKMRNLQMASPFLPIAQTSASKCSAALSLESTASRICCQDATKL